MLATTSNGKGYKRAGVRCRYSARTLHLVDIENLAGATTPSLRQVREVREGYANCLPFGGMDQVVIASSHRTLMNAGLGWPAARYRIRSGPDGADLELLDVLLCENVATRFSSIAIGSGDGIFTSAAAILAANGLWVTVVSRRGSLAPQLKLAAHEVLFIDRPEPIAGAARQLPAEVA